jgi:hypothetical protein
MAQRAQQSASSHRGTVDADIAANLAVEMDKVLEEWQKDWPDLEEKSKQLDVKIQRYLQSQIKEKSNND